MRFIPEIDFGVWWRFQGGNPWRVTWNKITGELYAVQQGVSERRTLAVIHNRQQVEALLAGWADPTSSIYCNLTALIDRVAAIEGKRPCFS